MLIDEYFKNLRKDIIVHIFALVIFISATIIFHATTKIIFGGLTLFWIICSYFKFREHIPTSKSIINVDIENKLIKLVNYPIISADEHAPRGYLWKEESIDIQIDKICNVQIKDNKLIFEYNYKEFLLPIKDIPSYDKILLHLELQKRQKDIGRIIELTDGDYNVEGVLYSGKIIDVMYYRPYKRVATIVDTRGYINTSISEARGNIIVLFNRYCDDELRDNRVVNTYVIKNDVNISDEKECLERSDFLIFCNLKYID